MQKLFYVLGLFVLPLAAFADQTALYVDVVNNTVGVNTLTPEATLDVNGGIITANPTSYTTAAIFKVGNITTTTTGSSVTTATAVVLEIDGTTYLLPTLILN